MKILFLILLMGASFEAISYPSSDHFDGEKFFNVPPSPIKGFWKVMKWRAFGKRGEWKEDLNYEKIKPDNTPVKRARVTYINHATFLLEFKTANILTDPIWSERASPMSFVGPKRAYAPPILMESLPRIDAVVISHNHYDHLDLESLKKLQSLFSPKFIVPLGDKKLLEEAGLINVEEEDWWESVVINGVTITFAPCRHWSARGMFDRNKSLWGSYFIQDENIKIYFAGDTGYGKHFLEIEQKFGATDVALLPIGAYEPRDFMKEQHMNPADAVKAHLDLKSKFSIGMHFGTFQLADEDQGAAAVELLNALKLNGLDEKAFIAPAPGQFFSF